MKRLILGGIAFVVLCGHSPCFAFYGVISSDTTWTDTVSVTGDVVVDSSACLRISPGARVIFSADTSEWDADLGNASKCDLVVYGSLRAIGDTIASCDSVVFTSSDTIPGGWGWIRFQSSLDDSVRFARISHGTFGFYCASSFLEVSHTSVIGCRGDDGTELNPDGNPGIGIYCDEGSIVSISATVISGCRGGNGWFDYVNYGVGEAGDGVGIYATGWSSLEVFDNSVTSCVGGEGEPPAGPCGRGGGLGVGIWCDSAFVDSISGNQIGDCIGGNAYPDYAYGEDGGDGIGIYCEYIPSFFSISRNIISHCVGGDGESGMVSGGCGGKGIGLYCHSVSSLTIIENEISDCTGGREGSGMIPGCAGDAMGIFCLHSSPTVAHNRVQRIKAGEWEGWAGGGDGIGVRATRCSSLTVLGNSISSCVGGEKWEYLKGGMGTGIWFDSSFVDSVSGNMVTDCVGGDGEYFADGGDGFGIYCTNVPSPFVLAENIISLCVGGAEGKAIGPNCDGGISSSIMGDQVVDFTSAEKGPEMSLGYAGHGVGVYCLDSSPLMTHNHIVQALGGEGERSGRGIGVLCKGSAWPVIGGSADAVNNIHENSDFNVDNRTTNEIDATYNYWGTIDSVEIAARILDHDDDPSYGWVRYSPWAMAPGVEDPPSTDEGLPEQFILFSNYPNPFNASTVIPYCLPILRHGDRERGRGGEGVVTLRVYNVLGQVVRTLVDGPQSSGHHQAIWDGRDDRGGAVASGLYLCRLRAGGYEKAHQMVLLR